MIYALAGVAIFLFLVLLIWLACRPTAPKSRPVQVEFEHPNLNEWKIVEDESIVYVSDLNKKTVTPKPAPPPKQENYGFSFYPKEYLVDKLKQVKPPAGHSWHVAYRKVPRKRIHYHLDVKDDIVLRVALVNDSTNVEIGSKSRSVIFENSLESRTWYQNKVMFSVLYKDDEKQMIGDLVNWAKLQNVYAQNVTDTRTEVIR